MTADVVAVVLCWNDADRVVALLERLRATPAAPGHVVVVDNGSAEDSSERLARAFPSIEVVRLPTNLGFAAAANRGMRAALARGAGWIWLLNTDIELPPGALAALLAAAGSAPRCGMAGAVLTEEDGRVQAFGGGRVNLWTGSSRHVVRDREAPDYLSAACLLLRADMLLDTGLFDEGYFFYWEDVDLGFRAREKGWRLVVAASCRVAHREGSSLGRWSDERWYHLFRGMSRFLATRAPLPRAAIALRLVVHSLTMLGHGRHAPVRGAWRAITVQRRRGRRTSATLGRARRPAFSRRGGPGPSIGTGSGPLCGT